MVKVILTVGCSGCGKSTWVDQQIKNHESKGELAVKIERDEIREFLKPGYWKQTPDAKFEKKVTEFQRDQIRDALESEVFDFIYISDTNLNLEFRSQLWDYINDISNYQAEVEVLPFFESLDLNLCLSRNKQRQRVVPDHVVVKQWKEFQNQYNSNEYSLDTLNKPVIWVSDLHAQVGKLVKLMMRFPPEDFIYVFAGDINDSNLPELEDNFSKDASFVETYALVHHIVKDCGGILLHSNHQKNLINLIRGKRRKLSHGLDNTTAELTWWGLDLDLYEDKETGHLMISSAKTNASDNLLEMANWFDSRPTQCEIVHNNVIFRIAHAYPDAQDVFQPFPKKEETYIYGCLDKDRQRVEWWNKTEIKNSPFGYIAGHYHTTQLDFENNVFVFDPDCGKDVDGKLGCLLFVDGEKVNAFTI
jgi:predicted kinase